MNSSSTPYFPLFNKENWKEMQNRSREIEKIEASSESPPQNGTEIPATSAHRKENEKIRRRRNYSCGPDADNMKKALDYIVENPESSRIEVAKKFNIDRKALSERLDGDRNVEARVGPRGYLSALEEQKLAQHLVDMASLGFGYDVYQAKVLVQAILNKDDTEITSSWFDGFMKRHPELSRRRAKTFSKNRMAASAIESVEEYFKLLEMAFNKCKAFSNGSELTSNRVYAADEIGFDSHINQGSIITKRGEKHPFIINANNSTHITLMAFASANGWAGTEFFLLPGQRQKHQFNLELKKYFPSGEVVMTNKGYMTEESFLLWAEFFIESIKGIRGDEKNGRYWSLTAIILILSLLKRLTYSTKVIFLS